MDTQLDKERSIGAQKKEQFANAKQEEEKVLNRLF